MQKTEITCDGCGADLTTRTNSVDYRLVLFAESKPGYGSGVYTDMLIAPPVDRPCHFCRLECLDHWRGRENYRAGLLREWGERWKREHGTEYGGNFRSYPCPPDQIRKARDMEIDAAALEAFPMTRPNK